MLTISELNELKKQIREQIEKASGIEEEQIDIIPQIDCEDVKNKQHKAPVDCMGTCVSGCFVTCISGCTGSCYGECHGVCNGKVNEIVDIPDSLHNKIREKIKQLIKG